jgi:hypothetical protein
MSFNQSVSQKYKNQNDLNAPLEYFSNSHCIEYTFPRGLIGSLLLLSMGSFFLYCHTDMCDCGIGFHFPTAPNSLGNKYLNLDLVSHKLCSLLSMVMRMKGKSLGRNSKLTNNIRLHNDDSLSRLNPFK